MNVVKFAVIYAVACVVSVAFSWVLAMFTDVALIKRNSERLDGKSSD